MAGLRKGLKVEHYPNRRKRLAGGECMLAGPRRGPASIHSPPAGRSPASIQGETENQKALPRYHI